MPANTPWVLADAGPRFTPLRFGLLSAAEIVDDADPHWRNGVQFQSDACGPDSSVAAFCVAGGPATGIGKQPTVSGFGGSAAEPFSVYAYTDCAPVGYGNDLADMIARAQRQLDRGENRAVERVVWTGAPTAGPEVRPHLAEDTSAFATPQGASTLELQSATQVVTAAASSIIVAMGLLEGSLALCYGGEGVIHVPARAVPFLARDSLIEQQGPQLRTKSGHKVAVYSSGNRHGPTGAEPAIAEGWFYATGAVVARRSPVTPQDPRPGDFVGKSKNDTVLIVERTYVIDWDCCHLAAQVTFA